MAGLDTLDNIVQSSLYREVRNVKDGVSIVEDPETGALYYKKTLSVFSVPVYTFLKENEYAFIPKIKLFWQEEDNLVVIEELIRGNTLENLLENNVDYRGYRLAFEEKKRILLDICTGLQVLHAAKPPIIHRDIKASNIVVSETGVVKIIDYNAAKQYVAGKSKDTVLIGTQGSAAPEQYGFAQSDERTDIYALGKLLERMLPESKQAMKVAEKATKLQPELRYKSVAEMRKHISRLKSPEVRVVQGTSNGASGRKKVVEFTKKKKVLIWAISLGVILLSILAGVITFIVVYDDGRATGVYEGKRLSNETTEAFTKSDDTGTTEVADTVKEGSGADENSDATASLDNLVEEADKLVENGEYIEAEDIYREIIEKTEKDSSNQEIYEYASNALIYTKGLYRYENGNYVEAIKKWMDIPDFKDTSELMLEAKYKYVKENEGNPSADKYRLYLRDLTEAGYSGEGMDSLSSSLENYSADISWGTTGEDIYDPSLPDYRWQEIKVKISAGPFGGTTDVTVKISDSSGNSVSLDVGTLAVGNSKTVIWNKGDTISPVAGTTYTVTAYDGDGNEIGSLTGAIE